ncbi:MAG: ABC transporter ATP-binding protein [Campylobacterota bacterium]|nr:ABC transporter ATP-binding protein [Campylobacterota bacterium]
MIVATDISLSYDGEEMVIEDGNFKIESNEFIIITGSSGSGKSTLLKALYGELPPIKGHLLVNGVDISNKNTSKLLELRKTTGIIFQDYQLIEEMTVEENIMIPLKINNASSDIANSQVEKLLEHVKLSHKAKAYPNKLSGGEQQRVAVARALAHNPKVIFADEPTGNLDKFSADLVWKLFKDVNDQLDVTVIVVTHTIPEDLDIKYRKLSIDEGVIYEIS